MKQFSCGAVVPGCDAKLSAESEQELLEQVAEHAQSVHGMDSVPPELVAQVREKIETV
jgi:predicted small metal-binding protein